MARNTGEKYNRGAESFNFFAIHDAREVTFLCDEKFQRVRSKGNSEERVADKLPTRSINSENCEKFLDVA